MRSALLDGLHRVAAARERAADLFVADVARHPDRRAAPVQIDLSGGAVDAVEQQLDAVLAVRASHAVDLDEFEVTAQDAASACEKCLERGVLWCQDNIR